MLKNIPLILLPLALITNAHDKLILEKHSQGAKYYSKEQLKLPASISIVKTLKQVEFESVQVNTDVNGHNTIGDAANEPSIAVNPLNPNQIAIGWRQFNTVTNSFRQAGRSYSNDGGITWNYQQVFEPGVFRSDPVLASTADGEFYYQSLRVEFDNQGIATDFIEDQWKSYDGGASWVEKTFAFGGDKSWMAVDHTQNETRGNIYAVWNVAGNAYFPATYNSSLNNGLNFTTPIVIPRSPIFGGIEVGPNGEVYVIGINNYNPPQSPGSTYLIKTNDPNIPNPSFTQVTPVRMRANLRLGAFINEVGLAGQLYVKVDKSERSTKGNVYVLGSMEPLSGGDPLDVMLARSTNGGITFSRSVSIGAGNNPNWQWFGTTSIAPNGRLDVIYYDTKNDDGSTGNGGTSRLNYTYSYDGGLTFAKEQAISPRFNNLIGYPVQRKMGDYIDMDSDNLGAHIAYTATFNSEQDVYYLHVQPSSIEENPDFPSLLTNNAWAVDDVPSQGILSSTLINNNNPENPLLAFEAIFTAKPDGTPMWLVGTGAIPKFGDEYTVPVFMPTGDLSDGGQAILAIGTMKKKRLRDDNNELIDNKIEYSFDFSDEVQQQLQDLLGHQYNADFFANNPFHDIVKTLVFNSLLPREQKRQDLCNINGQVLISAGEKSEGRLQYTYARDGALNLFAADFTYKKTINSQGIATIDLDSNGLATPTWEVLNSSPEGVLADNSVINTVAQPNGGLGFFVTGEETGISIIGTEQVTVNGTQLTTQKPDTSIETLSILANNAYCGEIQAQ
jgi:hypothetical protein